MDSPFTNDKRNVFVIILQPVVDVDHRRRLVTNITNYDALHFNC